MNRTNLTFFLPVVISVVFAACNGTEQTPAPSPPAALNPAPTLSPFEQSATTAPQGSRWEEVARWGDGADGVKFNGPNGITIDAEDCVYTTEFRGHRVQKFTSDGVPVGEWGGPGTEPDQLTAPTGIVVGPDGRVYVTESGGHRVQVFDNAGQFLHQIGGPGTGSQEMTNPTGVAIGPEGDLWVMDRGNNRIQRFRLDGTFVQL